MSRRRGEKISNRVVELQWDNETKKDKRKNKREYK